MFKTVIAFAVLVSTAVPAASQSLGTSTVEASSLRARSAPSAGARIVSSLSNGATVSVIARQGKWFQVQLPDGREAWMHSGFLSEPVVSETQTRTASEAATPAPRAVETSRPVAEEAASSDDTVREMTVVEYIVQAPELVGERVRIKRAKLYYANPSFILMKTGASSSTWLVPPWADRSDLNHMLTRCTGFDILRECTIDVTARVLKERQENVNKLTDVDFIISE